MAPTVEQTAQSILNELGGPQNITSMSHCATRLRLQLADRSKVDQQALDADPAVLGVVPQGSDGLQIVMGGGVANYYQALRALPGMDGGDEAAAAAKSSGSGGKNYGGVRGKFGWVDYAFEFLSDTFRPILWALLGASLIITILVLFDTFGVQDFRAPMDEQPPLFVLLHSMWRCVFYFLPIMVGASAARKLGADMWVGAAIPAAFLTPEFLSLASNPAAFPLPGATVGETVPMAVEILGIPLVLNDYAGQVFPALFSAVVLFWVEKGLKKVIPAAVQMVFVPFISILVMVPLTGFLIGPFGIFIGNGISTVLLAVQDFSPFILSIIVPLLYPFLVPLGLHWPLNAIMIQNIATLGYDFIQGPMGAWNFACFGLMAGVLIVSIREKNRAMRQVSMGGLFAGLFGGISEPSLYGVVLRYRKTYLRLLPGCLVGGIVAGFFSIKAQAFVFTSLLTIPAFDPMGGYALAIAAAFLTSMLLVIFFDYRSAEERDRDRAAIAAGGAGGGTAPVAVAAGTAAAATATANAAPASAVPAAAPGASAATATSTATATAVEEAQASAELASPMTGRLLPLSEVPDPAFSSGAMGPGCAIDPSDGLVVSPAAGTIAVAFPTGHAVGIVLRDGTELLIHVGIDTVSLNGSAFTLRVAQGDTVEVGTPLIEVDLEAIAAAGLSAVTPILITNAGASGSVELLGEQGSEVRAGDPMMRLVRDRA